MVFGDPATGNYTEINKGNITSKNAAVVGDATLKSSSMELDHSKLEVAVADKDSNGHLTMTADQTSIKNSDLAGKNYSEIVADKDSVRTTVKDEKDNTTSTKSSATEIRNYAKDAAGNKTNNVQTATQNKSWAKDKDGNESSIVQTGKDITNTAQNGTITNDAQNIVNKAATMDTTVTGKATESYGELDTTVNGNETHHVTGKQTNKIDGNQENTIGGNQTTTVTGDISNKAENITNEAKTKLTDTAGDSTVTTENGKGTTFAKTGSAAYSTKAGAPTDTNIAGNLITTGRVDANELGVSDKDGANSADLSVEAGEGKGVKASAGNGTTTGSLDVKADEVGSSVKDDASGKGSTFKQRIDAIMGNVKTDAGESEVTQKGDEITSKVGLGEATNSRVTQKKGSLEAAVTDGTNTNVSYDVANASAKKLTDGTNTSVQNQTASLITSGVKDGAGNENASAATATTLVNTIKSGSKANIVLSTVADGTSFINSDAMTPVTDESGANAGTAVNTTIKGNTITTGKVTMDYADVMRDLGVRGNATVDKDMTVKGNTTLGEAGKDTTLTVNSKATFNEKATFEKGAEVKNGLTVSSGGLNVTGESTFNDKVTMNNGLDVTGGVASDSFTVKGTDIKIDSSGINAGGTVISNVADGSISEGSKDAVNGGQLYQVKNDLEGKVNKVGANAAAMANLHPMEFDPDSKWNIAAAMGNYGSETATAIGAFYRPNEDVMVNFSTAFGTGENMVGGGVSVRLGKGGNKLSREETNALKAQVNDLTARMDALLSVLNPNMSKDFPDVPENHWAYEAVSRLAGNDIVQGYPDGEFHGERTMTRYEMAEIIYNALSRGAEAERELVEEFKPELQAMAASEKATAEKAEG